MPYPTVDEFKTIVLQTPLETIAQDHILQGIPFVFRNHPEEAALLRAHLSQNLGVQEERIIVVGSARIGFSLNPENFPRAFRPESDIDVAIVDETLFDEVWFTLLKWQYPRRVVGLPQADKQWASERRKNIFWGWLVPDQIRYDGLSLPEVLRPLRDLSAKWFSAFRSLARYPFLSTRDVSGRLYRSWGHATHYHVDGLRQIRDTLRQQP